jgi:hypothetical protein
MYSVQPSSTAAAEGAVQHALHRFNAPQKACRWSSCQTPINHSTAARMCKCCTAFLCNLWLCRRSGGVSCRVFERDGVRVVCDTVSIDFLRGAVLEYEDSLMRSAFQV